MVLSQARIERFVLDSIREHSDIEVERGVLAESFEYDETSDTKYPITVTLRHSGSEKDITIPGDLEDREWEYLTRRKRSAGKEIVKAKYIIGCDGAHSWTRKQLDIPFEGASTEHIWFVFPPQIIDQAANIAKGCDRCRAIERLS
jgi:phenol 2-monooxygenase